MPRELTIDGPPPDGHWFHVWISFLDANARQESVTLNVFDSDSVLACQRGGREVVRQNPGRIIIESTAKRFDIRSKHSARPVAA